MPVAPSIFFFQQKNEILMAPLREKLARSQFQEKESMSEIKKPKMSKKFYYLKVPISTSRVSQTRTRLPQSVESICSLQILGTVLWIVTPKHGSIVDPFSSDFIWDWGIPHCLLRNTPDSIWRHSTSRTKGSREPKGGRAGRAKKSALAHRRLKLASPESLGS